MNFQITIGLILLGLMTQYLFYLAFSVNPRVIELFGVNALLIILSTLDGSQPIILLCCSGVMTVTLIKFISSSKILMKRVKIPTIDVIKIGKNTQEILRIPTKNPQFTYMEFDTSKDTILDDPSYSPIAEANVYATYGRYKQALDVLVEALHHPRWATYTTTDTSVFDAAVELIDKINASNLCPGEKIITREELAHLGEHNV